jgi:glucose/mannose-6-phosphate isomerase
MIETTMDKLITDFPQNIKDALAIAAGVQLRSPNCEIRNVVVCGMGGSGIGGKIVSQWVYEDLSIPFTLVNDYVLPYFVNEYTLVIASSYSGNTEETLSAVEDGLNKNAHVIAICSGGKLENLAKEKGFDAIIVPGGNPPRSALAFSLVQLVSIFEKLELVTIRYSAQLAKSAQLIVANSEDIHTQAKAIAAFLKGKMPIIYATTLYEGVAVRARQQFNENSKVLCWHHVIPEMNHNELVGWTGGNANFASLFLVNGDMFDRNAFRLNISKEVMEEKGAKTVMVSAKGESRVEESMYFIHLIDWSSWYLSELYVVDPIAIPVIDYLKGELDKF